MRTVNFFLTKAGIPLPTDSPPPPEYAPWAGATITFERTEADHAPGVVRLRGPVGARTDGEGRGSVALVPGRYRIVFPTGDTFVRTLAESPDPIDLSTWLAGGVEPGTPEYETLLEWILQNPNLQGPPGPPGESEPGPQGPPGPPGAQGAKVEPVAVSETDRTYFITFDTGTFEAVYLFDQLVEVGGPPTPWPDLVNDVPDQIFTNSPSGYIANRPATGFIRRLRFTPIYADGLTPGFGVDIEVDP